MPVRRATTWLELAAIQCGLIARRQLVQLGYHDHYTDSRVSAEQWQLVSDVVVCTTTGVLTREQLMWAGVLHAGPGSAIGGLTALERRGLRHWARDEITVLLPKSHNLQPLEGVRFVETRRPIGLFATGRLPTWRAEPAALLYAGYAAGTSTALGLLAAVVQQRMTTPARLLEDLRRLHPLRRSRLFRASLQDVAAGSHSLAELGVARMCREQGLPLPDRQVRRADASGRLRYLDCVWHLADGTIVILEVDGGLHMEVAQWERDIRRERDLVTTGAVVLRCTTREVRDVPEEVAASLRAIGVGRSSA